MLPSEDDVFVGASVEVTPFGTFIEHPGGAHGLLHGDTVEVGAQVRVRVIAVDAERRRFSLAKA